MMNWMNEELDIDAANERIQEIIGEMRHYDRELFTQFVKLGSIHKLNEWIKGKYRGRTKKSIEKDIKRIRKYIADRYNGKAKPYTASIEIQFYHSGNIDDIMYHLEQIDRHMVGMLSEYRFGNYIQTILK
jgi:hypothetical protein